MNDEGPGGDASSDEDQSEGEEDRGTDEHLVLRDTGLTKLGVTPGGGG